VHSVHPDSDTNQHVLTNSVKCNCTLVPEAFIMMWLLCW